MASCLLGPSALTQQHQQLTSSFARPRSSLPHPRRASACDSRRSAGASPVRMAAAGTDDLLVVGAGHLGSLVARQWLERYPFSQVFGQTRTDSRHAELASLGITPVAGPPTTDKSTSERLLFPFVIFCAPPSGNADYPGTVQDAAQSWNGEGTFLFTSSSAVYDVSDNGPCLEEDPVCPAVPLGRTPRVDVLLSAEAASLNAGGSVARLAGLYTKERGAHTFWLKQGAVDSRPDHILNLIHYEDAASLCVAILLAKAHGEIFMGCDNHPLSRQELMDITVKSGAFDGQFNGFSGTSGPLGKRMNNSKTRRTLNWAPKYESFEAFLAAPAQIR